jgi:hypothetical protein
LTEKVSVMLMRPGMKIGLPCAISLLLAAITARAQLNGGPYTILPLDINGGGTTSTGGPYSISASTAQPGGVGTITAEPVPAPPLYQFDDGFWSRATAAPGNIVWDTDDLSTDRTTRSLWFRVTGMGASGQNAIRVESAELMHAGPRNAAGGGVFRPGDFSKFDTNNNGVCSGATATPNYKVHPGFPGNAARILRKK